MMWTVKGDVQIWFDVEIEAEDKDEAVEKATCMTDIELIGRHCNSDSIEVTEVIPSVSSR